MLSSRVRCSLCQGAWITYRINYKDCER
ncbi:hypothetical protein EPN87_02630 [archaeon]|nr:MAG: hypothetical protein EPN87_02630 [archaeon]